MESIPLQDLDVFKKMQEIPQQSTIEERREFQERCANILIQQDPELTKERLAKIEQLQLVINTLSQRFPLDKQVANARDTLIQLNAVHAQAEKTIRINKTIQAQDANIEKTLIGDTITQLKLAENAITTIQDQLELRKKRNLLLEKIEGFKDSITDPKERTKHLAEWAKDIEPEMKETTDLLLKESLKSENENLQTIACLVNRNLEATRTLATTSPSTQSKETITKNKEPNPETKSFFKHTLLAACLQSIAKWFAKKLNPTPTNDDKTLATLNGYLNNDALKTKDKIQRIHKDLRNDPSSLAKKLISATDGITQQYDNQQTKVAYKSKDPEQTPRGPSLQGRKR